MGNAIGNQLGRSHCPDGREAGSWGAEDLGGERKLLTPWVATPRRASRNCKEMDETWLPTGAACPELVVGPGSAGFQPHAPAPVAHTVAFGKSSVFCLENVAVGPDCHEMPGEGKREEMNVSERDNMNEVSLRGSVLDSQEDRSSLISGGVRNYLHGTGQWSQAERTHHHIPVALRSCVPRLLHPRVPEARDTQGN